LNVRIVAFADTRYADIASNWIVSIERLGLLDSTTLIALDEPLHRTMVARGVRCELRPPSSPSRPDLWCHRIAVLREMLDSNTDAIVHSDVDAVWLRNPSDRMLVEEADFVFSQGTVWPPESLALRKFVVCCGLYLVRPTDQARAFLAKLTDHVAELASDQWAVNRLIDLYGLAWRIEDPYKISFREQEFVASPLPIRGFGKDLSVSVIPHGEIPRLMTGRALDGVLVAHPVSGKTAEETESVLRHHGLWLATEDDLLR
jgi:hypothetical protein